MTTDTPPKARWKTMLRRGWPWLVLASILIPAIWHVVDFDEDIDPEFPKVERPTFSRLPAAAYRLAEPGDTLDRVELYLAAAGVVMAVGGLAAGRERGYWPVGLAIALAGLWYSATPGPAVDGWYGLGWRTIFDPRAPWALRAGLIAAAVALAAVVGACAFRRRRRLGEDWAASRARGSGGLWIAALVLTIARQFEVPGVEPAGYWPRWAMIGGLLAFDLGLLIELVPRLSTRSWRWAVGVLTPPVWVGLVAFGIAVTWYHRPLARLKVVVPDRIYISAMPTPRGLEIAQERRHFRTIINLFPEDTPFRSPFLEDELKFAREHGIKYVASPSDPSPDASDAFLNQTLALAQDASAWPILVHCHGCMDRSPAWMGIYRFVVQGRPLLEVMQEIEQHRGYRPKGSVTLLYNRVLAPRAPEHYRTDPTAAILQKCAEGTFDPMVGPPRRAKAGVADRDPAGSEGRDIGLNEPPGSSSRK
jgi:Tyrosine phosphatase family